MFEVLTANYLFSISYFLFLPSAGRWFPHHGARQRKLCNFQSTCWEMNTLFSTHTVSTVSGLECGSSDVAKVLSCSAPWRSHCDLWAQAPYTLQKWCVGRARILEMRAIKLHARVNLDYWVGIWMQLLCGCSTINTSLPQLISSPWDWLSEHLCEFNMVYCNICCATTMCQVKDLSAINFRTPLYFHKCVLNARSILSLWHPCSFHGSCSSAESQLLWIKNWCST